MAIFKKVTDAGYGFVKDFFGGTYYGDDLGKHLEVLRHRKDVMASAVYRFGEQLGSFSDHYPEKAKDWERFLDMTLQEFGERSFPIFSYSRSLDLAEALADLAPQDKGLYYTLTCPKCGEPEALIYKGSTRITCNRGKCGLSQSLWDYVHCVQSIRGR